MHMGGRVAVTKYHFSNNGLVNDMDLMPIK